jgi:hypothetical protein
MTSAPSSRSQRANRMSIRSTARRGVSSIAMNHYIIVQHIIVQRDRMFWFSEIACFENIKRRFKFEDAGNSGFI